MKILKSPVFLICCILFVLHQVPWKGFSVSIPGIDSFLDSFLAMPLILTLLVAERRLLFKRGENYRLSGLEVGIATLFIAFFSEILFPLFSEKFIGDWWDLLFYSLGSLLFYFTINPFQGKSSMKHEQ